jgi:hypothetical protein
MDAVHSLIHTLYETPLATSLRESEWTFPVIQTFHILGILLFYGGVALVDLRVLGVVLRQRPANEVARALLPPAWVGFIVMAASGGLLFAAQAEKIYTNIFLLAKFALIGLAGMNLVAFHLTSGKAIAVCGGDGAAAPPSAKAMAAMSFLLWTGVVIAGRFIAYF